MSVSFLVTGGTGHQGGSVPTAKELESLGAMLFVGDYSNVEAINKATFGVRATSSIQPRNLRTRGAKPNRRSVSLTPLSLQAPWSISSPAPDSRRTQTRIIPFIEWKRAVEDVDIGRWTAAAFAHPETFAGKELDLSAENVTHEEAVSALSKVSGVEIATAFFEPADVVKDAPAGDLTAPLRGASAAIQNQELAELKGYGVRFTTFVEFLEKNKAARSRSKRDFMS
ncbi:hypothetical protein EXIGLDRAFT_697655 [Exidia glandulosa HHB12029]|uniref:NmrA-like domain-containing protein n=1 Tax=Exidia glandulosa HHB12029 TaxID=1314781 RepID=A0A165EMP4_EXIGL|nr:hypothetical protein EXIGLDRAFT_697655 [Exidia glandulosa HHB12029]